MELALLLQNIEASFPEAEKQKRLQHLAQHINHLIQTDFNQLVQVLYTVDVDEQELKKVLQQNTGQDAAQLIAALIWTRTEEKARCRRQFSKPAPPDGEERW
jgi:hypothetical protein